MTKTDAIIIISFTVFILLISIFLQLSLFIPFFLSAIFTVLMLKKNGFELKLLINMIGTGINECRSLYLLILLIGANISIWMASGIVPAIMYYGFDYLQGVNFIFMAFLLTAVMSFFMGTAVGTISTIGIALLGIGRGFVIPEGVLLGTLISAAFLADKISPISGLVNLTLRESGTTYLPLMKKMLKTLIPVFLISAGAYYILGLLYSGTQDLLLITSLQDALSQAFNISPLIMLLPLMIAFLPLAGVNVNFSLLISLGLGSIITVLLQNSSLFDLVNYIFRGYQGFGVNDILRDFLISGGAFGMIEVVFIVAIIVGFSNLLEQTGVLKVILAQGIENIKSPRELIGKSGLTSSLLTGCDQTVGIVLTMRLFKKKYRELAIDNTYLARTVSDAGTILAPLIPWNVNTIIIMTATNIAIGQYWPYTVLCILFPFSVLIIYLNKNYDIKFRNKKLCLNTTPWFWQNRAKMK